MQPIYLHFRLKNGTGNDSGVPDPKPTLRKVISVNGEALECPDFSDLDIHDNATFEKEEHLPDTFFNSLRRRSRTSGGGVGSLPRRRSFSELARSVIQAEGVVLAFRNFRTSRRHSSSSESSNDESEHAILDNNNSVSLSLDDKNTHDNNNTTTTDLTTNVLVHDSHDLEKQTGSDLLCSDQPDNLPGEEVKVHDMTGDPDRQTDVSTNEHQAADKVHKNDLVDPDTHTTEQSTNQTETVVVVAESTEGQSSLLRRRTSSVKELARRGGCPCVCILM